MIIGMVCVGATSPGRSLNLVTDVVPPAPRAPRRSSPHVLCFAGCLVGFELVKLAWSRGLVRANVFDWSFGKQPKGERGGSADPEAPETDGLTMEEDQLLKGSVFPALISPYEMAGSSHLYQVRFGRLYAEGQFLSERNCDLYMLSLTPAGAPPIHGCLCLLQ